MAITIRRIKMKKIIQEFKEFITRGNVIDLAVGMIIGAAFTAIVTALVNSIFKPLIDAIPMGNIEGLITMLVARDADGNVIENISASAAAVDLSKSTYIDWGAFIMAIVNFLLTAIVLFIIIKVINTVRAGMTANKLPLDKAEVKRLKSEGMSRKQIKAYAEQKAKEEAEAKAAADAANAPESTEHILGEIRELLKALNPEAAAKLASEEGKSE